MRLQLLAVGRLKAGPERELVQRYQSRIDGLARSGGFSALATAEFAEGRARSVVERRAGEAAALLGAAAESALVVFDERAESLPSPDFAERLRAWRDGGRGAASFVIGGPDGLDGTVRARADLALSFGRLTLPHQLVRVLVVEQVYRALTILASHPYHRGGADTG